MYTIYIYIYTPYIISLYIYIYIYILYCFSQKKTLRQVMHRIFSRMDPRAATWRFPSGEDHLVFHGALRETRGDQKKMVVTKRLGKKVMVN